MDFLPTTGFFAVVGNVIGEITVEIDLSFTHELKDEQRRELLGHRTELEFRLEIVWNLPFEICVPEGMLINDFAIASHENRAAEIAFDGVGLPDGIHPSRFGSGGFLLSECRNRQDHKNRHGSKKSHASPLFAGQHFRNAGKGKALRFVAGDEVIRGDYGLAAVRAHGFVAAVMKQDYIAAANPT